MRQHDAVQSPGSRQELVFLVSDVVGSTELWIQNPDAMDEALNQHDVIIQRAISEHGGCVFKAAGDSFMAWFHDPPAAVSAAIQAQDRLLRAAWPRDAAISVRIALHLGQATRRGTDLLGEGPSVCSKICERTQGRQILASEQLLTVTRKSVRDSVRFRPAGHLPRDRSGRQVRVFQVVHPSLPSDFPTPRVDSRILGEVPKRRTRMFGREVEIARLRRMLATSRLVTLTGVGGAGKTRLAQSVGRAVRDDFPEGVRFVPLDQLDDQQFLASFVARVVGSTERVGGTLVDAIASALGRDESLLILDNCEQFVEAVSAFADLLLDECPNLRIIATSRERLRVEGERVLEVGPLPVPESRSLDSPEGIEDLRRLAVVRLFADRASSAHSEFRLRDADVPDIARLCRRLDGIPLAIELIASNVAVHSVADLLSMLDARLGALEGGPRGNPERQRTMWATMQWSLDLLTEAERTLLGRLSVFNGFTVEAMEAVCPDATLSVTQCHASLPALREKSLIVRSASSDERLPFGMLGPIRAIAQSLLTREERVATYSRMLSWCEVFVRVLASAKSDQDRTSARDEIDLQSDNISAALTAVESESDTRAAARMALGLWGYWISRQRFAEGIAHYDVLVRSSGMARAPELVARLLHASGSLAYYAGRIVLAEERLGAAFENFRSLSDRRGVCRVLNDLGNVSRELGFLRRSRNELRQARRLASAIGEDQVALASAASLGLTLIHLGALERAVTLLEECLADASSAGDTRLELDALVNLALARYRQVRLSEAASLCDRVEKVAQRTSHDRQAEIARNIRACILIDGGEPRAAIVMLGQVYRAFESAGEEAWQAVTLADLGLAASVAGRHGEAMGHLDDALRLAQQARLPQVALVARLRLARLGLITDAPDLTRRAAIAAIRDSCDMRQWWRVADALETIALYCARQQRDDVTREAASVALLTRRLCDVPRRPLHARPFEELIREQLGASEPEPSTQQPVDEDRIVDRVLTLIDAVPPPRVTS